MADIKQIVQTLHLEKIRNNEENTSSMRHITQIVNILGGIDEILQHYLSESCDAMLDIQQLNKLKQLLETPEKYQSYNKSQALSNVTQRADNIELNAPAMNQFVYHLDETNTCLNTRIGDERAIILLKILHHNLTRMAIVTMMLIGLAFDIFLPFNKVTQKFYVLWGFTSCILFAPYTFVLILSSNHIAFPLVLQSFEFWYKLVNSFCIPVLYAWIQYLNYKSLLFIIVLQSVVYTLFSLLTMTFISSLDAFHLNKIWKVVFTAFIAVIYTVMLVWCTSLYKHNEYYVHTMHVWIIPITLETLLLSAVRVATIFSWKQAILSIIRYNTDECVVIKHIASIKWDAKQENITESNIDHSVIDEMMSNKNEIVHLNADMHDTDIDLKDSGLRYPTATHYEPSDSSTICDTDGS